MYLDPDNVRQIAANWGYHEVPVNQESTISFRNDEKCGGVRINVFFTTGTVATLLDHPIRGKNHLFRRQVNYQGLHEVFSNPRVHTGTGYHNRRERNNMVNGAFSRMEESESSESVSETCVSQSVLEDLDPNVRDKFGRLAQVLKETNQNLVTFEFLLSHYRSLARVAPLPAAAGLSQSAKAISLPSTPHDRDGQSRRRTESVDTNTREIFGENKNDSGEILHLLKNISESLSGFREHLTVQTREPCEREADQIVEDFAGETSMGAEVVRDGHEDNTSKDEVLLNREGAIAMCNNDILRKEEELTEKNNEIDKLKLDLLNTRQELLQEREMVYILGQEVKKMEEKLGCERVAAKEMATEIKYYVEKLSKVEETVVALRDSKQNEKVSTMVDKASGDESEVDIKNGKEMDDEMKEMLEEERRKRELSEIDLSNERERVQGLVDNIGELREKLTKSELNLAISDETHNRLKSKTRKLLRQYRVKRGNVERRDMQLSKLREGLLHLRSLCKNVESNYQVILRDCGQQIHVAARLLSLHLGPATTDAPGDVTWTGRLNDWFEELQSVIIWLHTNIARLGVRQWAGGRLLQEGDTRSDMSCSILDRDVREDAVAAARICDEGLNQQHSTVDELIDCLDTS